MILQGCCSSECLWDSLGRRKGRNHLKSPCLLLHKANYSNMTHQTEKFPPRYARIGFFFWSRLLASALSEDYSNISLIKHNTKLLIVSHQSFLFVRFPLWCAWARPISYNITLVLQYLTNQWCMDPKWCLQLRCTICNSQSNLHYYSVL